MSNIDKTVLITGATAGIGYATAILFAKNGYNLILTGRREDKLKELTTKLETEYKISVKYFTFDIRERIAVKKFTDELVTTNIVPDILVNNAGLASGLAPIDSADIDDWDEMIDTNIKGLLYITRGIVPMMIKANRGHIINIGSIAAYQPYAGGAVYNATKFAVKALTDAINLDLVETKIRVSAIHPGMVETEFSVVRFKGDKNRADKVYEGISPLIATDIADTIYYIATLPERINIPHLLIFPTAQRSINSINRDNIL